MAKLLHPDKGGTKKLMSDLSKQYEDFLKIDKKEPEFLNRIKTSYSKFHQGSAKSIIDEQELINIKDQVVYLKNIISVKESTIKEQSTHIHKLEKEISLNKSRIHEVMEEKRFFMEEGRKVKEAGIFQLIWKRIKREI